MVQVHQVGSVVGGHHAPRSLTAASRLGMSVPHQGVMEHHLHDIFMDMALLGDKIPVEPLKVCLPHHVDLNARHLGQLL